MLGRARRWAGGQVRVCGSGAGAALGLGDLGRCAALRGWWPPGGALDSQAAPTRPRRPRPGAAPRTFCSRSMQHGARRPGHSQSPVREGRGQRVRLRAAAGRCALGAAKAAGASPRAGASSSLGGDSPGCREKGGRPRRGGVRLRDLRGRQLSRQPGPVRLRLPIRSAPENARVDGRRPRDGLRLFLSHCSLVPKEMTAGVSLPPGRRPPRPGSAAPALPSPAWPVAPAQALPSRPLVPLPLGTLSPPPPPGARPGRVNREGSMSSPASASLIQNLTSALRNFVSVYHDAQVEIPHVRTSHKLCFMDKIIFKTLHRSSISGSCQQSQHFAGLRQEDRLNLGV